MGKYKHKKVKDLAEYKNKKDYDLRESIKAERALAMKIKKGRGNSQTSNNRKMCHI